MCGIITSNWRNWARGPTARYTVPGPCPAVLVGAVRAWGSTHKANDTESILRQVYRAQDYETELEYAIKAVPVKDNRKLQIEMKVLKDTAFTIDACSFVACLRLC